MSVVSHCLADTATRGVAMVPKLVLDVMSCEVMRVLQLTDSCIVPISYQVPRKVCTRCTYTQSRYAGNVLTSLLCCSNPVKYVCVLYWLSALRPGVSWRSLPRHCGHDSRHVCCGVVGGRKQAGNVSLIGRPSSCCTVHTTETTGSTRPQVDKVSLHPDKRPKQKAPPAKQTAKKDLASAGSKEVRKYHHK